MPLPPISFFADESDQRDDQDFTQTKPAAEIFTQTSVSLDAAGNTDHALPSMQSQANTDSTAKTKTASPAKKSRVKSGASSRSSRESKRSASTESSISGRYESPSDAGSEFGDNICQRDIEKKLPLIQKDIATMLKLDDPGILKDKLKLIRVSEGTVLCKEGDYNGGLMFVLEGQLYGTQKELSGDESSVFTCHKNQICGNLSVISGEPSLFTIRARCDSEIAVLSKENFHKIIAYKPVVVLSIAYFIVKRMSPFVRQIDFALEWNLIEAGDVLFRQDAKAENIYIVLNGRLRSILKVNYYYFTSIL
jgi:CRP-like cAMP-binding protein